mmetsp:Transcript_5680/g.13304  ORF Transcript_5680/g.13304 Transcript_5680/m.13304 type:complete len:335 (-) Transcript_5680:1224-2228(-)
MLQEVSVPRAAKIVQRVHLHAYNPTAILLEHCNYLAYSHGHFLGEGDEHHGASAVGVIADANFIGLLHVDGVNVEHIVLLLPLLALVHLLQLHAAFLGLFGLLVLKAEHHSLMHCGEEPLLANELLQPGPCQGLVHSVPHHTERSLDITTAKVVHDVLQDMNSSGIDGDHRCHLENDVGGFVDLLKVADEGEDHVLHIGCVGKIHGGAYPANEDIGDKGATPFLLHVAVDGCARDAPQDGDLRTRRLVDDNDQREPDGHCDAHEHTQEKRANESHNPQEEVSFLDPHELDSFIVGHERDYRVQHNGRQGVLGQVVEERREEHESAKHDHRGDEA